MARPALPLYRRPEVIAALVGLTAGIEIAMGCQANRAMTLFGVEFLGALLFILCRPPNISVKQATWAGIGYHQGSLLTAMALRIETLTPGRLLAIACTSAVLAALALLAVAVGVCSGLVLRDLASLANDGVRALTRFLKGAPQRP